jgi:hypothetical protein
MFLTIPFSIQVDDEELYQETKDYLANSPKQK